MFVTTLEKIRVCNLNVAHWQKLLAVVRKIEADSKPFPLLTILDCCGYWEALFCCRSVEGHNRDLHLFAIWCARQVEYLMGDERSRQVLRIAEDYTWGRADEDEMDRAWDGAWEAEMTIAQSDPWSHARYAARAAVDAALPYATQDAAEPVWTAAKLSVQATLRVPEIQAYTDIAPCPALAKQEARFRLMLTEGAFIGSTAPQACSAK